MREGLVMLIDETNNEANDEEQNSEELPADNNDSAGDVEEVETDQDGADEGSESDSENDEEAYTDGDSDKSEFTVTIGDATDDEEEDPLSDKAAPGWVKKLRKDNSAVRKENKELRKKIDRYEAAQKSKVVEKLGAKPTLESCNYDESVFESEFTAWQERKRKHDEIVHQENEAKKSQEKNWNDSLASYGQKKAEISAKVSGYEDSEAAVSSVLNETQLGIIVHAAENSALMVHALGKNQKELERLANIKDPVKFAFAVSKIEGKINMSPKRKRAATSPEKKVSGQAGGGTGSVDKELDRLRTEAERTGNYTSVMAFKRKHKMK
jgi:hypothetical protein